MTISADAFARFLTARHRDLQRIARHTRGEHSLGDVQGETWIMVDTLAARRTVLDLDVAADQQRLIARLYQHLVRYTELNVRHAVRLDHSPGGEEGESHPLMGKLGADEHCDPVVALMQAEDAAARVQADEPTPHQSLAAAYLHLIRRFDNRMRDVADHLLISASYCYRRCAHARRLAVQQQPLPAAAAPDSSFVPGAWRRFRMLRTPVQLCFDFDVDARLFGMGEVVGR